MFDRLADLPCAAVCCLWCVVCRRELSFWRALFAFCAFRPLPAELLDVDFRCADIAVLECRRREVRRPPLSDDGSEDALLGAFFADYPNDSAYVTREEEQRPRSSHSTSSSSHRPT